MQPPNPTALSQEPALATSARLPRRFGWIAFGLLIALPGISMGGCLATCSATEHSSSVPWKQIGPVGGIIAIIIGVLLLVGAAVSFAMAGQRARWQRRSDIVGLVLSILLGPGSILASSLWWFMDTSGLGGFGGGWGRPLRLRGRDISPTLDLDPAFPRGPRPDCLELTVAERALLGDMWMHDTKKEWASVPAFSQVAWHLAAVGAPPGLVQRALMSAQQEIDHARRCSALASTFAGVELGPLPMPELCIGMNALPTDMDEALRKLAADSLTDGAYIEDYNAELAAAGLVETRDPAAIATLERIVHDERMHAELGWDIVAYCIERGGPAMEAHLREAWERVPDVAPAPYSGEIAARVAEVRMERLVEFGRVRPEHWVTVHAARKAALTARLEQLLCAQRHARKAA